MKIVQAAVLVLVGALGALLSVHFITQLNATYYNHWRFDAGTRDIARFLTAQPASAQRAKITASGTLVPCLNFYRELHKLTGWGPVERWNGDNKLTSGDYVVIDPGDIPRMPSHDVTPIFTDRLSGAFVALYR